MVQFSHLDHNLYGEILFLRKFQILILHWKIINYLTSNYKNIVIGNFSTKDISNKKTSNIDNMTKRIGLMMRHYVFRKRLEYKCQIRNVNLKIVNESYTSKICSKCTNYHKTLKGNKIYNCDNCHTKMDRDINGCRGILLKALIKS